MIDGGPDLVAQIPQHIEGGLERPAYVARTSLTHVVREMPQEPRPVRVRVPKVPPEPGPGHPLPVPPLPGRDPGGVQQPRLGGPVGRCQELPYERFTRAQQRAVIDALDLLGDQRPQIGGERQPLPVLGPPVQPGDGREGQQTRLVAAVRTLLVLTARVVRHPAPRPGDDARLPPRRLVAQTVGIPDEPPAPLLGQQREHVEEVQPEPAYEDGLARRDRGQVEVGGVRGAEVAGEARFAGRGADRKVPLREDHPVKAGQPSAVGQQQRLRTVRRVVERDRRRTVLHDGDMRGRGVPHRTEHVLQVRPVEGPRRIVVRPEPPRSPLVQTRPLLHRAVHRHRVVREHRDLRGHRVHQQPPRLIRTPHLPGPRRVRIDDVHGHRLVRRRLPLVRTQPLQDGQPTRPRSDKTDDKHGLSCQDVRTLFFSSARSTSTTRSTWSSRSSACMGMARLRWKRSAETGQLCTAS
ncbi:hypothetical protein Saa2_06233 [Streptomyces acidiscabies]|nr:hypothetical protein Saa2_06233 [Streptomyces acidiscabies]